MLWVVPMEKCFPTFCLDVYKQNPCFHSKTLINDYYKYFTFYMHYSVEKSRMAIPVWGNLQNNSPNHQSFGKDRPPFPSLCLDWSLLY